VVFRRQVWYLFHLVRQAVLFSNTAYLLLVGRTSDVENTSHLLEVALESGWSNDLKQASRLWPRIPERVRYPARLDDNISCRCQKLLVAYLYPNLAFQHIRIFIPRLCVWGGTKVPGAMGCSTSENFPSVA